MSLAPRFSRSTRAKLKRTLSQAFCLFRSTSEKYFGGTAPSPRMGGGTTSDVDPRHSSLYSSSLRGTSLYSM